MCSSVEMDANKVKVVRDTSTGRTSVCRSVRGVLAVKQKVRRVACIPGRLVLI